MSYYASNYCYNKRKENAQDTGDDEAKIVEDDSNHGIVMFMTAMSKDEHKTGSWFLESQTIWQALRIDWSNLIAQERVRWD